MPATALITGSAQRVGAEIARHLAGRGYAIGLHYHHSAGEAETLADEIRALGVPCAVVQADLADEAATGSLFAGLSALPPVELLVHNASRFERDGLESFSRDGLQAHMAINLAAPLELSRDFLRRLPAGHKGQIVCLLDGMTGWSLSSHFLTYSLSRKALEAAIELLAYDLAPQVRINGIALGPTLPGKQDTSATFAKLERLTPLQRVSSPAEVCAALDYLIMGEGVTGQVLDLSGGMSLLRTQRPE